MNVPKMTTEDVFERLVEMASASNGGAAGASILTCDLVSQDALYQLQSDLATLLADIANACGPRETRMLDQRFPRLFERR